MQRGFDNNNPCSSNSLQPEHHGCGGSARDHSLLSADGVWHEPARHVSRVVLQKRGESFCKFLVYRPFLRSFSVCSLIWNSKQQQKHWKLCVGVKGQVTGCCCCGHSVLDRQAASLQIWTESGAACMRHRVSDVLIILGEPALPNLHPHPRRPPKFDFSASSANAIFLSTPPPELNAFLLQIIPYDSARHIVLLNETEINRLGLIIKNPRKFSSRNFPFTQIFS